MTFGQGIDGSDPVGSPTARRAGARKHLHAARSSRLATGTLACPLCDAPVALASGRRSPADPLDCPFCRHAAPLRDFLSLSAPSRPARVAVRVVHGARRAVG